MGVYSNNAHGIQLDSRHTNVNESKIKSDFIVAIGGNGETPDNRFSQNVQIAYDLKIPLLMIWQIDFTFYSGANLNSWEPSPENEYNLKAMKEAIYYPDSTAKRAVDGIILDITNNKDALNNQITQVWIGAISSFIYQNSWNMFKLPQYVWVTQEMLNGYNSAPNLLQWLTNTNSICSWKSATPGANTQMASWSNFPIPPDTYKPQYIASAPNVYFSRYANTAYTFDGIQDAVGGYPSVPLYQYMYSKDQLYKDLNFVSSGSVTPTPNPVPTPVVPGSGVDLTPVLTAISGLSTQISGISTQLTNLENRIDGIFK